ncbi:MAG: alanine racemase [Clostridia bacterium]|nr:alanine racemase [Clostridia bacterium]
MRAWAEINLDNIAHNISCIRKSLNPETKLLVVIKADGYGHGYKEVAKVAVDNGADFFGVASADEAMQLRRNGFDTPILILGPVDDDEFVHVVDRDISITVFNVEIAKRISSIATALGKKARLHIKVDTGMSRIGYMAVGDNRDEMIDEIIAISKLPNISIDGIFTHFSKADDKESDFTQIQFERFIALCDELKQKGLDIPIRHCCNSGGIVNYPQYHLDMVRSGIITYGYYPSEQTNTEELELLPAMQLKSKVTDVKRVGAGIDVSYGGTYTTEAPIDIATFGIGYADGYFRSLSNKAEVIVGGCMAKVIGRVCMDQTMADVTEIKNIKIGDEVILFGTDGNNTITVDSVAALAGTINYEVLSVVGKRVPRVYIKDGKVVKVLNYLV